MSDKNEQQNLIKQVYFNKRKDITVQEYFENIDERINNKIALGIKQGMNLILKKIDVLI